MKKPHPSIHEFVCSSFGVSHWRIFVWIVPALGRSIFVSCQLHFNQGENNMSSSRVIDHFILVHGEPGGHIYKNIGDYFDEMYSYRDFDPSVMYSTPYQRQKDLGLVNPDYHSDSIDPRDYDA